MITIKFWSIQSLDKTELKVLFYFKTFSIKPFIQIITSAGSFCDYCKK